MMRHPRRCMGTLAGTVVALSVAMVPSVGAQSDETLSAVSESFCALFTQEEVDAVAGGPGEGMLEDAPTRQPEAGCLRTIDAYGSNHLIARWDDRPLDAIRTSLSGRDGWEVTVGGQPGWSVPVPTHAGHALYVELGPTTIALSISIGTGHEGLDRLDREAELLRLGELAVERVDTLAPTPWPSYVERLIPATVGDETMQVSSRSLQWASEHPTVLALTSVAAEQGRLPADVTWASGEFADGIGVEGMRIYGADASAFTEPLVRALLANADATAWDGSMSPGSLAGKDVLVVPLGEPGAGSWHVYASDDIVWLVTAPDPALTTILEALP